MDRKLRELSHRDVLHVIQRCVESFLTTALGLDPNDESVITGETSGVMLHRFCAESRHLHTEGLQWHRMDKEPEPGRYL